MIKATIHCVICYELCCVFFLLANRDPGAKMLGDRFATVEGDDNSIYR